MAMSVVYTTINGQIVHENRGGVEAFYTPDTLGSTVALLSTTGSVTDTYTYQPYGEIVSHVGSSVTPFTFVGTFGYYLDILGSQIYVRARYLRQALTRWQTIDPLWPFEGAYNYCMANPIVKIDPIGAAGGNVTACNIVHGDGRPCTAEEKAYCRQFSKALTGNAASQCGTTTIYFAGQELYTTTWCLCSRPMGRVHELEQILKKYMKHILGFCMPVCLGICSSLPGTDTPTCDKACKGICGG